MNIKTYSLLALCLSLNLVLSAQAVLTAPARLGDQDLSCYEMTHLPKLTLGKNQLWDFRSVDLSVPLTGSQLSFKTVFERDTVFLYCSLGYQVYYGFYKDNQWRVSRIDRSSYRLCYDEPRLEMQYPLSFESHFSWSSPAVEYFPHQVKEFLSVRSESRLLAYGNLVLPNGKLINDAFLVQSTEQYFRFRDSTVLTEDISRFYSSDQLWPHIEIKKQYSGSGDLLSEQSRFYENQQAVMSFYYPDSDHTDKKVDANSSVSRVSPNPTSNELFLDLSLEVESKVGLCIQTLAGHTVLFREWSYGMPGNYRQTLYLDEYNLPAGTYLVTVFINDVPETHKIQRIKQ